MWISVAIHGFPRFTDNLDVLVNVNVENAKKIIKALHEFGFAGFNLSEQEFLEEDNMV